MAIPAYYSLIQRGSTGPDVALVQTWLNGLRDTCTWYHELTTDGRFGIKSVNAVKEFQLKNDIRLVLQYPVYHLLCAIQRICVISVDHQVTFRIDLTEHPAYYISLSLCIFIAYDCSCLRSQLHSAVGGIVIIYIGHCLGQELFHIRHHLGDGLFLVIAGNQYRNFIHFPFLVFHLIIQSIT